MEVARQIKLHDDRCESCEMTDHNNFSGVSDYTRDTASCHDADQCDGVQ